MTLCACGCGGAVKAGKRYATKTCWSQQNRKGWRNKRHNPGSKTGFGKHTIVLTPKPAPPPAVSPWLTFKTREEFMQWAMTAEHPKEKIPYRAGQGDA